MAALLRGGKQPLRHQMLGFALGAGVAAAVALDIKMKVWRKTADAAEMRLSPPEGPETMKEVDGVLDTRQRQFLAREWNKVRENETHTHTHTHTRTCTRTCTRRNIYTCTPHAWYVPPIVSHWRGLKIYVSHADENPVCAIATHVLPFCARGK